MRIKFLVRNCEGETKKDFRLISKKERRWMELAHDHVHWRGHCWNFGFRHRPPYCRCRRVIYLSAWWKNWHILIKLGTSVLPLEATLVSHNFVFWRKLLLARTTLWIYDLRSLHYAFLGAKVLPLEATLVSHHFVFCHKIWLTWRHYEFMTCGPCMLRF
jgi:hypothetical protein